MSKRDELKAIIKEKSYREGDFTLSSGLKSSFYIDLKPTILHPVGAKLVGDLMVEWITQNNLKFAGVGGLTLGADPIVMAVGLSALEKGFLIPATMIRKEPKKHGTSRYIEGVENFKKGDSFLVVEDVVTTGGSAQKAIEILRAEGYKADHVISIVDRESGGRAAFEKMNCQFHSLFQISEFRSN